MKGMFEQSNRLSDHYEGFYIRPESGVFPVKSHWHYFCEMLYITDGTGYILCDGREENISAGDFVFFPPQAVHAIYDTGNLSCSVLKYDIGLLRTSKSHVPSFGHLFSRTEDAKKAPIVISETAFSRLSVRDLFETCIQEILEKQYGYDLCIQAHLTNLLTQILRIWRDNGFDTDHVAMLTGDSQPLYAIAEYIDENLDQPLKVEDLAARCNMSYSYFAKRFQSLYGRSCKEYIEFIRITRVKDLLLFTDFDLNYISQETGFSDCSHLIRTFKKLESTTPKQYKKQRAQKPAV